MALQPDIVLVERSVARTAQDQLLDRGISLALNLKRSVLDFLSRCTGAEVLASIRAGARIFGQSAAQLTCCSLLIAPANLLSTLPEVM